MRNFQISRPCEVRRPGQATTSVAIAVFSLSFQAVMLLTKTAINHYFFNLVWVSGWIQEIPTVLSKGAFTLQPYRSFFWKFSSEVENASCGAQFRYFQIK